MADYRIEVGRFLDVARELLKSEYNTPWADRFSITAPVFLDTNMLVSGEVPGETSTSQSTESKTKYCHTCDGETFNI